MKRIVRLKLAALGVVLAPLAASAADMPRMDLPMPTPLPERVLPMTEEWVSGWYIRGDVGYRWNEIGSVSRDVGPPPAENTLENATAFGLGVGYKNRWFRADITGDYLNSAQYQGSTGGAITTSAQVDGFTVLANVYLDLGTWWGFTPYVGAGAGGSYLTVFDYTSTVPPTSAAARSNWGFAWSYQAGVAFQIAQNLLLDVSYRHLELGDAVGGPDSNRLFINNISSDEVRVGLRYTLD